MNDEYGSKYFIIESRGLWKNHVYISKDDEYGSMYFIM